MQTASAGVRGSAPPRGHAGGQQPQANMCSKWGTGERKIQQSLSDLQGGGGRSHGNATVRNATAAPHPFPNQPGAPPKRGHHRRGLKKKVGVRCGPVTTLQPRLPSHDLHRLLSSLRVDGGRWGRFTVPNDTLWTLRRTCSVAHASVHTDPLTGPCSTSQGTGQMHDSDTDQQIM